MVAGERRAAALWALATAVVLLAWVYTVSLFGIGALLGIPLFNWLRRHARVGRAPTGILLGAAAFPAWLAAYHQDFAPAGPIAVAMVVAFLAVWRLAARGRPTL